MGWEPARVATAVILCSNHQLTRLSPPWKGHEPCLVRLCVRSLAELLNPQKALNDGTSHTSVCISAPSVRPWLSTRNSHPFLQLRLNLTGTGPGSRSEARTKSRCSQATEVWEGMWGGGSGAKNMVKKHYTDAFLRLACLLLRQPAEARD